MGYYAKICSIPKGEDLGVKVDSIFIDINKKAITIFDYGKDYSWFLANLAIEYLLDTMLPFTSDDIEFILFSIDSSFYGDDENEIELVKNELAKLAKKKLKECNSQIKIDNEKIEIYIKQKCYLTIPSKKVGRGILLMNYIKNIRISNKSSIDKLINLCVSNEKLKKMDLCLKTIAALKKCKTIEFDLYDISFFISF